MEFFILFGFKQLIKKCDFSGDRKDYSKSFHSAVLNSKNFCYKPKFFLTSRRRFFINRSF